jgi:hypothetical protein
MLDKLRLISLSFWDMKIVLAIVAIQVHLNQAVRVNKPGLIVGHMCGVNDGCIAWRMRANSMHYCSAGAGAPLQQGGVGKRGRIAKWPW